MVISLSWGAGVMGSATRPRRRRAGRRRPGGRRGRRGGEGDNAAAEDEDRQQAERAAIQSKGAELAGSRGVAGDAEADREAPEAIRKDCVVDRDLPEGLAVQE